MLALAEALIAAVTVAAALYAAVAAATVYWLSAARPYGAPVWPGVALGVAAAAAVTVAGGLALRALGA